LLYVCFVNRAPGLMWIRRPELAFNSKVLEVKPEVGLPFLPVHQLTEAARQLTVDYLTIVCGIAEVKVIVLHRTTAVVSDSLSHAVFNDAVYMVFKIIY